MLPAADIRVAAAEEPDTVADTGELAAADIPVAEEPGTAGPAEQAAGTAVAEEPDTEAAEVLPGAAEERASAVFAASVEPAADTAAAAGEPEAQAAEAPAEPAG